MPRVFVTRRLPVDARASLGGHDVEVFAPPRPPTREELERGARGAEALVPLLSDRIDAALLDACPRLRVVACYSVGTDNVDLEAAAARGVVVTNTPDVLTEATADVAWTLLLGVARRTREGERLARTGDLGAWSPTALLGVGLCGATLGIFGFGRIGRAIARRARGFGMRVVYTSRSEVPGHAREGARPMAFDAMLRASDVVAIAAPLTDATRHAFDARAFSTMKPGAILVNAARGPIVDEEALVRALERGHLRGAGLDVYEHEPRVHPRLLGRDDVMLLPHVGSATTHTRRRMAEIALANVRAVLAGEPPLTPVGP